MCFAFLFCARSQIESEITLSQRNDFRKLSQRNDFRKQVNVITSEF